MDKATAFIGITGKDTLIYFPQGSDGTLHPGQNELKSMLPDARIFCFSQDLVSTDSFNHFSLLDPPSNFFHAGRQIMTTVEEQELSRSTSLSGTRSSATRLKQRMASASPKARYKFDFEIYL